LRYKFSRRKLEKKFEIVKVAKKMIYWRCNKGKKKTNKISRVLLNTPLPYWNFRIWCFVYYKKKDKLYNVKQQVKDFLDNFLSKPEPEFTYHLL